MWSKKYVIVSDLHYPFTDIALYKLIIELAIDIKATHLIINGDGLDFYQISKFIKYNRKITIQEEIDGFCELLKYTRKVFNGIIYFINGNHETRLEKFLFTRAQEISTLRCLNLPELLNLNILDIIYVPKWLILADSFNGIIYHGNFCGENSSKRELLRHGCNLICAHTHKRSSYELINFHGRISCFHTGTIADKAQIDQNCKYSDYMYWSQSFGILNINKETYQFDYVNCDNGGFVYNEKIYKKNKHPGG